jgi:UDP-N-acetylglucosamine transferase subunit ALG13
MELESRMESTLAFARAKDVQDVIDDFVSVISHAVGGALEKWPIFESLLITLRTGDMLVLVMVMVLVLMNFEVKN